MVIKVHCGLAWYSVEVTLSTVYFLPAAAEFLVSINTVNCICVSWGF